MIECFGLDFETYDPYIRRELGAGWVYKVRVPTSDFKVIGWSSGTLETGSNYYSATPEMVEHLKNIRTDIPFVMHNATYDLGCLRALDISIKDLIILDTKIIAQLYDNTLYSYSLDPLAVKYLNKKKDVSILIDTVKKYNLAPEVNLKSKVYEKRLIEWSYSHMDKIQDADIKAMGQYCNQDVNLTLELLDLFLKKVPLEQALYYSKVQKIAVKMRERGIKVDLDVVREGITTLGPKMEDYKAQVYSFLGKEINLESPKQLNPLLVEKGYDLALNKMNNPSADKKWLNKNAKDDKLLTALLNYREVHKLYGDFFEKILDIQQYTCPGAEKYGWVFPEIILFGAHRTGRFSSSAPNIQQIPKRSKEYGALTRRMFVPTDPNNSWISLDWSNQEGRLQVHFASLIGAPGVEILVRKFKENPNLDLHGLVVEMTDISRDQAKTINLGLSYGMGEAKLCDELGLATIEVKKRDNKGKEYTYFKAGTEASAILNKYHNAFPYLKVLSKIAQFQIDKNGFILTLNKRKLKLEDSNSGYKAMSKLIQGSAADQMIEALIKADELGADIICIVHDEFNIEGGPISITNMRQIMEDRITPLVIPMIAVGKIGPNWGELHEGTL